MEKFENNKDLKEKVMTDTHKELSEYQQELIVTDTIKKQIAKINKITETPIKITYPETIKNQDKFPQSINIGPVKPDASHPLMIYLNERKFTVKPIFGTIRSVEIKKPGNITINLGLIGKTYGAEKLTDLLLRLWANKGKHTDIKGLSGVNVQEI